MDRPALEALLGDLEAGKVDVVVVYKVDRLTRSLADFAKMVELFDRHRVSFVSVTQQFNTTSSMGRLTLNVLLSFAQFEREVTGERIRDKIAASKKKGMWMGGSVPLGYDLKDRKLLVNSREAELVRRIYARYLALGCVRKLQAELAAKGVRSRVRKSRAGRKSGGVPYSRGALYDILQSRLYLGEIAHRGAVYQGQHDAIVPKALWEKIQGHLKANGQARRLGLKASSPSLLAGLLYDSEGNRFTPLHTTKNGKRYRYYASQAVIRGGAAAKNGVSRIPAHAVEELVAKRIKALIGSAQEIREIAIASGGATEEERALLRAAKEVSKAWVKQPSSSLREFLCGAVCRITITEDSAEIAVSRQGLRSTLLGKPSNPASAKPGTPHAQSSEDVAVLRVEARLGRIRGETQIILPNDTLNTRTGQPDPALLKAIARAHQWYEMLSSGEIPSLRSIATSAGLNERYVSRALRLAFLAPDIVERLLKGTQPAGLTLDKLMRGFATTWEQQRARLLS